MFHRFWLSVDSDPYSGAEAGPNAFAIASVVSGALTFLGSGCCCVPIVSLVAGFVVPVLGLVAVITGILGMMQAAETGSGRGLSIAGIGLGVVGVLVALGIFTMSIVLGAGGTILQEMQR